MLGSGIQPYIDTVRATLGPNSTDFTNEDLAAIVVYSANKINLKLSLSPAIGYIPAASGFSPEPSDDIACFIVMQSNCTTAKKSSAIALGKGIRVRDGDSEIDTSVGFGGLGAFQDAICDELDELIELYRSGGIGAETPSVASIYGCSVGYAQSKKSELVQDEFGSPFRRRKISPFGSSNSHPRDGRC